MTGPRAPYELRIGGKRSQHREGMMSSSTGGVQSRSLILTAMIFAVAMTFIDQTIVSIAAPTVQHDLGLSSSGMQWAINAYLLTLAAFFAFGGRLADTRGHRKMVVLGVIIFAGASALCGATPRGSAAEAWLVAFRALQGLGGAIMFPAAIAIVVVTFDLRSRGRALALFFGIAGGLTAIGPIAGGYLIEWTWRSIFWINIPVALIALALIAISKPANEARPAPMDYRGLALIVGGVGLSVFGFQQSALWGWGNPAIEASIAVGVVLLAVFFTVERRTESPLINVRIFENRTFLVENVILGIAMMAFIPVFFFAAIYGQIALGEKVRHPRHDPDHRVPVQDHLLAHREGPPGPGRLGGSRQGRPVAGRERQHRQHPAVHPRRLRRRHPRCAVRDVRDHGRRRVRGPARSQAGRPAGRRGRRRPVRRRGPGRRPVPGPALTPGLRPPV